MSIIYEALKKTQQTRTQTQHEQSPYVHKQPARRFPIGKICLIGLSIALLAFSIWFITPYVKRLLTPPPPVPKPIVKPHVKLTLNGVFLSDHDKIAMINKQLFHLGDTINDMKIISIDLQSVKLQGQNGSSEVLTAENLS